MFDQCRKDFGRDILQRRAARIAGQIERFGGFQGIAALGLAKVTPGDLTLSGDRIDELDDARPGNPLPYPLCHFLHDQPQSRIIWGPLGLPQKPRRGAFPGAGHGS